MVTSTPRTSIPAFLDAGAVAGLVAAGLVAAAWAFVHFGSGAASQGDAPSGIVGVSSSTSALDSPVDGQLKTTVYAKPSPASTEKTQGLRLPSSSQGSFDWQRDDRWIHGRQSCRLGKEQVEAAYQSRTPDGDFLSFRSQLDDAREKIEGGLRELSELSADNSDNARATREIDALIAKYQKTLLLTRK
ncbi:MAG: hypothetical protein HN405_07110 [Planctomycetes bacterium]|jgi:hypothetical protein|nr:hypothetical protein [Planctomycetota bacterium]MBT4029373.1 hypothetical protein [Planctomycetota bacterium]MBT4559817.1 hypothetical protein [Planctomycetota bacterium]MBT5101688.1 hypothetical protein [Planctomycetota bacterium]MBT7011660.1 hypothetical protein [Planctomycetota bacterium]